MLLKKIANVNSSGIPGTLGQQNRLFFVEDFSLFEEVPGFSQCDASYSI